jgi:hypothetical protein
MAPNGREHAGRILAATKERQPRLACANEHRVPLATRDRRALETYRALEVEVEWIE